MICIVSQSISGFTRLPVLSVHTNTGTNLMMYGMCEVSYCVENCLTSTDTCFSVWIWMLSQVGRLVLMFVIWAMYHKLMNSLSQIESNLNCLWLKLPGIWMVLMAVFRPIEFSKVDLNLNCLKKIFDVLSHKCWYLFLRLWIWIFDLTSLWMTCTCWKCEVYVTSKWSAHDPTSVFIEFYCII